MQLLTFIHDVRQGNTRTRVFAVTGDTGIGKSSLVAKLRDKLGNTRNAPHYSVLAVDMRAAKGPGYVMSAVLESLRKAARDGYGRHAGPLEITNALDPLGSDSIAAFLASMKERGQVAVLILDQFEELYSKPDLFTVFEEAQRLLISSAAACSPLVVGFVFRSDSLVQQDHPAYYMWNRLADHRFELRLRPFVAAEVSSALTKFQKELGQRLEPDLRRKLAENCAGLPWLLKKLCIHVMEQIHDGRIQRDLDNTMDVESLFARDIAGCTKPEHQCIRMVAKQSPADWHDVVEAHGAETVRSLQDKRLIIRNGDRLNLYWDVFREYVLTQQVPSIPITHLWSSPSIGAFLSVAARLTKDRDVSAEEVSQETGLSVKTVYNVIHDLAMFGVGAGSPGAFRLSDRVDSGVEVVVLERLRSVLRRHAFTKWLSQWPEGTVLQFDDLVKGLRAINPAARHSGETWRVYAERLGPWFVAAGILDAGPKGWTVRDSGQVRVPSRKGSRFRVGSFHADAPPAKVAEALHWLSQSGAKTSAAIRMSGYRNAVRVLERLELAARTDSGACESVVLASSLKEAEAFVFRAAAEDETLAAVREWALKNPHASGVEVGSFLAEHEGQVWTKASRQRIGNAIFMWANWVSPANSSVPSAPGPRTRRRQAAADSTQLFS